MDKLVNVAATGVAVLSVVVAHRIATAALEATQRVSEREKQAIEAKTRLENAVASGEYDAQFNTVVRDKEVDGSAFLGDKNLMYGVQVDSCRISGEGPVEFGPAENVSITGCTFSLH